MTATWLTSALTRACGGNLGRLTGNRSGACAAVASKAIMSDCRPTDCPFCSLPPGRILELNAQALAVADAFPVSPGHTLVIPRRHVISFFELTEDEVTAVHALLRRMKDRLDENLKPGGYNIGINFGAVA